MAIRFFLPMIPPTVTAQERGVKVIKGKPIFYDTPEIKTAKEKLMAHLSKYKPSKPIDSACRLVVKWLFPIKGKHRDGEYKTSRPDTDNLQKLLKDVMTVCGFWIDDAYVASEVIEKFWAETPGIFINVEELDNDTGSA